MDAMTRDYIRFQRSEIMRAQMLADRRGGPRMLETHEQWVAEVETAIGEYRKVFPIGVTITDPRIRHLVDISA